MRTSKSHLLALGIALFLFGCKATDHSDINMKNNLPEAYRNKNDSANTAKLSWKVFFNDSNLVALIDTALLHNQELKITLQEIEISKNEIKARKGEYLPFVSLGLHGDADKEGRYTRHGALDENLDIRPNTKMPEPYTNIGFGAYASWELDVWKKLRNAKKSASLRYLSNVEGKNFMLTNLVSEMANLYYELLSLDNKLSIIDQNIQIQTNALESVKYKKQASQVTELAVKKFEAQLLNSKSLRNTILQDITSTENNINLLLGRYPQKIKRSSAEFMEYGNAKIDIGVPSQLLENRPDVKKAELDLLAADLNIKVARANFYPSLKLVSGLGLEAYKLKYIGSPESMMYNLAGELMAPIINRNAIKAMYKNSKAAQIQALYAYQKTVLNAYLEVLTQQAKFENYKNSVEIKENEVELLSQSVLISAELFNSARADYMEVLMTQRDAIESRMELVESKLMQLNASVGLYRALGGGWR